jgi:hypothetical protein
MSCGPNWSGAGTATYDPKRASSVAAQSLGRAIETAIAAPIGLDSMASVYRARGKFADAERAMKRALAIREKWRTP